MPRTVHRRHRRPICQGRAHWLTRPLVWTVEERRAKETGRWVVAVALTFLLHLLLWELLPKEFGAGLIHPQPLPKREVMLVPEEKTLVPEELLPEALRRPKPRFVEVNPEAPTNLPPETNNTGAATQRAAQPEPDAGGPRPIPRVDGELEDVLKIVNSVPRELLPPAFQPRPHLPLGMPGPSTTGGAKEMQLARRTEGPNPAQEKPRLKPEGDKGIAVSENTGVAPVDSRVSEGDGTKLAEQSADKERAGEQEGRLVEQKSVAVEVAREKNAPDGIPDPAPRPQLTRTGTTGILTRSNVGTNEAGVLALDARYSEYGDYSQRLIEIVQTSWWQIVERAKIRESSDKKVVVAFTLHKDGTVTDVEVLYSSASPPATNACRDAIEIRAPYDAWRADMVAMIGDRERSRFTFYYR